MKYGIFVFISMFLLGCNSIQKLQLLRSGSVEQSNYFESIPFEYGGKMIIIKAIINGQKGRFLFDTGAPNVLSKEFAKKLNLKKRASGDINDSGGNTLENQSFVEIENILIGKLNFKNTGAVVQDLGSSEILKCLNFDGIIGANLMRQAYWRIDYKNKKIELTDDLKRFNLTDDYLEISFKDKTQGTPVFDMNLDGVNVRNLVLDTGSNGHISVPTKAFKLLNETKDVKSAYSFGATSYGVGGKAKLDTLFYAIVDTIKFGNGQMENKIIEFSTHSDNVGNKFFENYDLILDWKNKKIHMLKRDEYSYDSISTSGFGFDWQTDGIYVGSIYHNSSSEDFLKLGDKVLKIETIDFEKMTNEDFCQQFKNRAWDFDNIDTIKITVLRDGKRLTFDLKRKSLLSVE